MVTIVCIEHNGTRHELEVEDGLSVMQAVLDNLVPGIIGDCGGCCSCATCHAYVDPHWSDRLPPPGEEERALLDGVIHPQPTSRLTCQLKTGPELDGLIVRLPPSQF